MREKLEAVQRQSGRVPVELQDLVTLPDSCALVWKWFVKLHSSRTSNGFGVNPLQFVEIKAYFDLLGIEPEEWEIDVIKKLDQIVLEFYAEKADKEERARKVKKK